MALPVRVSTPVVALKLPLMPFWVVKPSTSSPVTKLALIETAALARLILSASVTVKPASIAVALLPSVNASAGPVIVTTGAWFADTTEPSAVTVAVPPVDVSTSL